MCFSAPAALSFKEEKVQRDRRNNLYHFWLSDISPCSCHSPCLLSWCYCISHVCVCTSKVQTGLKCQKEEELKHDWMSCWSAHHSKLSSACSFSVNHLFIFFFLVLLFWFWVFSSFDVEYRLSAAVWGTAPVNPAHLSPFYTGLILPSTGLCKTTSEESLSPKDVTVSESES